MFLAYLTRRISTLLHFDSARSGGSRVAIPTLRSPTISAGGLIPNTHTASGLGISPALNWRRLPPGRPYLTIAVRSWLTVGGDEIVHWLAFDIPEFLGGLKEDVGQGSSWTTGHNSNGDANYLPFAGEQPRRVRFDMFASRSPTGLDGPAPWEDISKFLEKHDALGAFGFEAYHANLPALMGETG